MLQGVISGTLTGPRFIRRSFIRMANQVTGQFSSTNYRSWRDSTSEVFEQVYDFINTLYQAREFNRAPSGQPLTCADGRRELAAIINELYTNETRSGDPTGFVDSTYRGNFNIQIRLQYPNRADLIRALADSTHTPDNMELDDDHVHQLRQARVGRGIEEAINSRIIGEDYHSDYPTPYTINQTIVNYSKTLVDSIRCLDPAF